MDRRTFVRTVGLGGLAGLGNGVLGAPLPKPSVRTPAALLSGSLPQLVTHGASGLRTTGSGLAAFLRTLPTAAGSDDLQEAFGGKVWDLLSAHLPRTAADVPRFMTGHWGAPGVEQAAGRLAPIRDAGQWMSQAAAEVGYTRAQADAALTRSRQVPDVALPKAAPPGMNAALDALIESAALRAALDPLRRWRTASDVHILEGLQAAFRGLLAEPEHFATLIDTGFNAAAGILGPAVTAADIPSLTFPSGLISPTATASKTTVAKVGFFAAEFPFNLAVIALDCGETGFALDLPRIKLVLESASFVCSYGSGLLYGKPPLRTYQNDFWSIMSFGQDIVLDLLKRRRREIGAEVLDVIWGFVGAGFLLAYILGLIVDPKVPRPGLAVTRVAASDRDPWSWGPQFIWSLLTHVICRWAAPVANPEFWPIYLLPLWWMSVYLAGCLCEFGLWYSDYLKI